MPEPRVAFATCSALPDLEADDRPLVAALAAVGIDAVPAVWDDPAVDWSAFDLVVLRSTWDYSHRREEFVSWTRTVPHLANSQAVVEWNTDKHYLKELGERGVTIIDTLWLDPEKHLTSQAIHTRLPAFGDYVIKPTISAGSKDTIRYRESSAQARGNAILHARELLRAGRHVMVQRYLKKVDTVGETCVVFIAGEYSHTVRKDAMLQRDAKPTDDLYQQEVMSSAEATPEQLELAHRTLAATAQVLGIEPSELLYARVDMLPGDDDAPHLLELELTEPSLFFGNAPGSLERFVAAVQSRLAR